MRSWGTSLPELGQAIACLSLACQQLGTLITRSMPSLWRLLLGAGSMSGHPVQTAASPWLRTQKPSHWGVGHSSKSISSLMHRWAWPGAAKAALQPCAASVRWGKGAHPLAEPTWHKRLPTAAAATAGCMRLGLQEYAEEAKLQSLVQRYSEFINFPIKLLVEKEVSWSSSGMAAGVPCTVPGPGPPCTQLSLQVPSADTIAHGLQVEVKDEEDKAEDSADVQTEGNACSAPTPTLLWGQCVCSMCAGACLHAAVQHSTDTCCHRHVQTPLTTMLRMWWTMTRRRRRSPRLPKRRCGTCNCLCCTSHAPGICTAISETIMAAALGIMLPSACPPCCRRGCRSARFGRC